MGSLYACWPEGGSGGGRSKEESVKGEEVF